MNPDGRSCAAPPWPLNVHTNPSDGEVAFSPKFALSQSRLLIFTFYGPKQPIHYSAPSHVIRGPAIRTTKTPMLNLEDFELKPQVAEHHQVALFVSTRGIRARCSACGVIGLCRQLLHS